MDKGYRGTEKKQSFDWYFHVLWVCEPEHLLSSLINDKMSVSAMRQEQ